MRQRQSRVPLAVLGALCASGVLAEGRAPNAEGGIETIVVTGREAGAADRERVARIPGGASFIDMSTARERNVATIADALRYVPGVWAASHAGNDRVFFSSRGSNLDATDYDLNGIKLLQDGLPVTTADGNNHNRVVDPLSAAHATVARGANALELGASTLGGAINFVSPTGSDHPGLDVSVNAGSHGLALAQASVGGSLGEAFDAFVTLEAKRRDGHRAHSAQERHGLYANFGWQPSDRLSTRLYVTALENDHELPGALTRAELDRDAGLADPAAIEGHYQRNVDATRIASKTTWTLGDTRRVEFGASIEEQSLYHPIVWATVGGVEVFSLLIDTEHRNRGALLRFGQTAGRHSTLVALSHADSDVHGGHYRNLHGRPNGLRESVASSATLTELSAVDRWRLGDRLTLVLGGQLTAAERAVHVTSAATGDSRHPSARYERFSPRAGFLLDLDDDVTFYGNASGLFEPPTNYELEDNVAGGDATLAPMTGKVVELGTRRAGAGHAWRWDVSVYYAEIDDEILSVEDPSAPGTSLSTNVDRTIHAGIEAVVGAVLPVGGAGGTLEPTISVTVNEFRFDDDPHYGSNALPAAPEYFARGELIYRSARGWHVGPMVDVVGDRFADFANTYRIGSHVLVGLRAGWGNERWRAFAELRNLADRDYVVTHSVRNVASPGDRILNPGEPRSVFVGFEGRFE
ncbi:MAG TPA: TonB-dependent receptor [Gammaproteobacteria bacterium]